LAEKFSYTWEMGAFACKFVHYLQNVSAICSVMNLTGISIERYYAIVHPMRAKYICTIKQAKRIILILWILSFLFGIPTLFAQGHLPVKDNGKEFFHCRKDWHASLLWRFHEVYMFVVILIIPFTIMTYSYSRICWEVWNVMKRRVVMTSKHALTRARSKNENTPETSALPEDKPAKSDPLQDDTHMVKQVVYMLVAVVVLFAICWAPILIDNILTAYEYLPQYRAENLEYMNLAFVLMAYFNSCINPIIYGFMSKSFRESFKLVLCCNFAEARPSSLSSYSLKYVSHTKNTTT
ncbi:pyroglutamylated RFamide peptide receptor-like, partial [Asbolus verrucosus]